MAAGGAARGHLGHLEGNDLRPVQRNDPADRASEAHRQVRPAHRLGKASPRMRSGHSSASTSVAGRPASLTSANTKLPLSVSRTCRTEGSSPRLRAKPSPAFVRLPSASKALSAGALHLAGDIGLPPGDALHEQHQPARRAEGADLTERQPRSLEGGGCQLAHLLQRGQHGPGRDLLDADLK